MKKITITTIVATILIGIVAISVLPAEAHGPPHIHDILNALNNILAAVSGTSTEVSNIEAKLDDPNFGLQEIKNEVNNIEMKTDNLPSDPADNSEILAAIASISLSGGGYVPFKTVATGLPATCDVAGDLVSGFHSLTIDGGSDFMLTSVFLQPSGVDDTNDQIFVNNFNVDQALYRTESVDVTGLFGGDFLAFDVMGLSTVPGGKLPTAITAKGIDLEDIVIIIGCAAGDTSDITFSADQIIVSGWKAPSDTITATFS